MANTWTDELKQKVIDEYLASDPTAENSMEIAAELGAKYDQSPNGVRIIIQRAGHWVKKETAKASSTEEGGKRIDKKKAIADLKEAIETSGCEVDDAIIDKLTGKAALYFTTIINGESDSEG